MSYRDFRQFLDALRQHGELVDIDRPVAIEKGVLPPGTTMRPQEYMLPRELGGLYR